MKTTYLRQDNGEMLLLEMRVEDDNPRPFVTAAEQRYDTLAQLTAAHPELGTAEQLPLCCALCLHFARGFNFLPIDDPDEFRRRYQTLLRHGQGISNDSFSTADFGPFDVSEVSPPRLRNDKLVFYVEDKLYAVPYRVEAPWPAQTQGTVKFLLLPQE